MPTVDITGLDKARVLKALWDASHSHGVSGLFGSQSLSIEECRELLKTTSGYFDYLRGRVMKVQLGKETTSLDVTLYDRDNYRGAAEEAILEEFTRP